MFKHDDSKRGPFDEKGPVNDSWWTADSASGSPPGGDSPWARSASAAATVQRRAASPGGGVGLARDELAPAGGHPLPAPVQRTMERALGGSFGDVRIHVDGGRAQAMNAQAYTVGSDIVFGDGEYDPQSQQGQHTLAHELTHVLQQRRGPVSGEPIGGDVSVSDPSDGFETAAEDAADRAMGGAAPATSIGASGAGSAGAGACVQRSVLDRAWSALKTPYTAAKGLYNTLSQPEGSPERREAARTAFRETASGLAGDTAGGAASDYVNKKMDVEEAKAATVKPDDENMKVEGTLAGDDATMNRNLQGPGVGNIEYNGEIIDHEGHRYNKETGAEIKDDAPAPAEAQKDEEQQQ